MGFEYFKPSIGINDSVYSNKNFTDSLSTNSNSLAFNPIFNYNSDTNFQTSTGMNPISSWMGQSSADENYRDLMLKLQSPIESFSSYGTSLLDKNYPTLKNIKGRIKKEISPADKTEIQKLAQELNFNPQALINTIYAESGGDPQAVNPKGGATGIIQFMPSTAASLGTTTAQLRQMSFREQLIYVKKYLQNAKKSAGFAPNERVSDGQLYALIFMPGKAKKEVLCSAGTKAYAWNKGLDINKDGHVTTSELGARIA